MRLFIAEKASLAKAIVEAHPGRIKSRDRLSVTMDNGDVVCWSAGHILTMQTPDMIDAEYKRWRVAPLPIIPREWPKFPDQERKDLLANIGRLLKEADTVVHAGDADREGQLLIDEILHYFKFKGEVRRLLITDLNASAIQKAMGEMRSNLDYKNLSSSAEARHRADWIFGFNLTRLFTCTTERDRGEIISVGRVQTPTLALVVNRDLLIENFISKPFYDVKARSVIKNGEFIASWKPKEDQEGLDEEGRIIDRDAISRLEKKLAGKVGRVSDFEKKRSPAQPPLPHSLPTLQSEAAKKFDISPADTLKTAQRLYELKYTTYPRSDCSYLPESLYGKRERVIEVIKKANPEYEAYNFDTELKSAAWNTEKIEEHFAIIPTGEMPQDLSEEERTVFDLIARRYAAQFLPAQEFAVVSLEYDIEGEFFKASSRQCVKEGWHLLYGKDKDMDDDEKEPETKIPDAVTGEPVGVRELIISERKTAPPKHFTESTLLDAMNHIHLYVEAPEVKKILKETSGIGTAATQAKIIETLQQRQFIVKDKKALISTPKGRKLIEEIDDMLRKPDMTALWEAALRDIQEGRKDPDSFISEIADTVRKMTEQRKKTAREYIPARPQGEEPQGTQCPGCTGNRMLPRVGRDKKNKFWACSDCGLILSNERGKPQKTASCPLCGHLCVRIKGKRGCFWLCRNQECKKTFEDNRGKLAAPKP